MEAPAPEEKLVILVDDNPDHIQLIEQTLKESPMQLTVTALNSSAIAIEYVHRRGVFANSPLPDLIILDWDLNQGGGLQLLSEIKESSPLRRIPIIVLTLSDQADAVLQTYARRGNCHVVKSANLEELAASVRHIEEFWLRIVTLPTQ